MAYILKMMDGNKYRITDKEATGLATATGKVLIKSCKAVINAASISEIYPAEKAVEIEDRKTQQAGVLHDGTLVRKHFGEWVVDSGQVADDRGAYHPVRLDKAYYPEVVRDCVPTPEEFERLYKALPPAERLTLMLGAAPRQLSEGGMSSVKEILGKKT